MNFGTITVGAIPCGCPLELPQEIGCDWPIPNADLQEVEEESKEYRSFIKRCKWCDCFDKDKARELLDKFPKEDEKIALNGKED